MATAKVNKKKTVAAVDLPECPVCLETMTAPIFQCQSGHSLCNECTRTLVPPLCPICRLSMTQMRNWQLEEVVAKAKVPCPNRAAGCTFSVMRIDIDEHLKECIFREMDCPLGVFGKCSWRGNLKSMMDHFKERHPTNCNINSDSEVEIGPVEEHVDDRYVYLVNQGKKIFIVTVKIDTTEKMAYWVVQHIGTKSAAKQYIYEIHVTSKQDNRRKATFIEHCVTDGIKTDEVFRQGKCPMIPLSMLKSFTKEKKFSFRIFIKGSDQPKPQSNNKENNENKKPEASGSKDNNPNKKGNSGPNLPKKKNKA